MMTKPAGMRFVRYGGMSMWPGFQDGDVLEIQPLPIHKLRRGDIVVFRDGDRCQVVHRIVAHGRFIKTRGDALAKIDCFTVAETQLAGKVIRRYRLGIESSVPGGWRGHLLGKGYRLASRLNPMRPSRGGRLARLLRRMSMRLAGRLWQRGEVREVRRAGQDAVSVWHWRKRPIGRRDDLSGEWTIYWPWCLVLQRIQPPPSPSGDTDPGAPATT